MTGLSGRFILSVLVLLSILIAQDASAITYDPYLSHPSHIPDFANYRTPIIQPGQKGELSFTVRNRYDEPMRNVTLHIEIYARATIEHYWPIDNVEHPPQFYRCSYDTAAVNGTGVVIDMGILPPGINTTVVLYIKTSSSTPEGTYFIRAMMIFDYGNITGIVLKSRGYFTQKEWDRATNRGGEFGIDLDYLNCTGIIPDTSFSVKKPIPMWPFYILVALTAITGILALFFYMTDELGYFPEARKRIDELWIKITDFNRRKYDKKI